MHTGLGRHSGASLLLVIAALLVPASSEGLAAAVEQELASSKYVYIASTRKDGNLGKPAEIWFLWRDGSVYVGTPATSWRARRIKAGRPQAKIWVGKPDGPSFVATGNIIKDPKVEEAMLAAFATKYPDGWSRHAETFRSGFEDGTRVVIKYTPTGS
jgi:hypothetical protein